MTFTKWHNLTGLAQSNGKVWDVLLGFLTSPHGEEDKLDLFNFIKSVLAPRSSWMMKQDVKMR